MNQTNTARLLSQGPTYFLRMVRLRSRVRGTPMDDAITGAPIQHIPRLKHLTSVLDVYRILYKVK